MGSRRTQPYRKGPRAPGPALSAMKRGRAIGAPNPMDAGRKALKRARRRGALRRAR